MNKNCKKGTKGKKQNMRRFCVVDLETNGLDPLKDEIIEIGIIEVGIIKDELCVLSMYSELRNADITEETTVITGITSEMVKGRAINWTIVRDIFQRSEFAVAHNAKFDSEFLWNTGFFKDIDLKWYCSMDHIDWSEQNVVGRKLCHIGGELGKANPFPHRALPDCLFLYSLLEDNFEELIASGSLERCKVQAIGSAFSQKDILKENGYRWNPDIKTWEKDILKIKAREEAEFLKVNIYRKGNFKAKFLKIKPLHWWSEQTNQEIQEKISKVKKAFEE